MNERATTERKQPGILRQLAELDDLPTDELKVRWRALYAGEPPRFNRQFLIKRLAYRIQELAYGGLSDDDRARMDQVLDEQGFNDIGVKLGGGKAGPVDRPIAGTLLVREWQGQRHEVIVLTNGFEYRGRPYRSLTAVARDITGTAWNGLVFFGLRRLNRGQGGSHGKP
jgi:hypothetical protein